MFKFTRTDLTLKSPSQLAALFNEVDRKLAGIRNPSKARDHATLLAMIRAEQARREPAP